MTTSTGKQRQIEVFTSRYIMNNKLLKSVWSALFFATSIVAFIEPAKAETVTDFQQGETHDIPLNVNSRAYYTIDLSSHVGADADLYIYDANNVLVAKSTEAGSDTLEGYLNTGSYQIRIHMLMCLSNDCRASITVRRDGRSVRLW